MFMELVTWVEGSDVYQCWFNKKKLIKVLNSLGISDWKARKKDEDRINEVAHDIKLIKEELEK